MSEQKYYPLGPYEVGYYTRELKKAEEVVKLKLEYIKVCKERLAHGWPVRDIPQKQAK